MGTIFTGADKLAEDTAEHRRKAVEKTVTDVRTAIRMASERGQYSVEYGLATYLAHEVADKLTENGFKVKVRSPYDPDCHHQLTSLIEISWRPHREREVKPHWFSFLKRRSKHR